MVTQPSYCHIIRDVLITVIVFIRDDVAVICESLWSILVTCFSILSSFCSTMARGSAFCLLWEEVSEWETVEVDCIDDWETDCDGNHNGYNGKSFYLVYASSAPKYCAVRKVVLSLTPFQTSVSDVFKWYHCVLFFFLYCCVLCLMMMSDDNI